jgi:very-short-patch-repair endonuclease
VSVGRVLPPPLDAYAGAQFGLLTRAQALEVWSSSSVSRRVASGLFVPVLQGVYRLPGALPSWRQRALAWCLAAGDGAVVSHLAAAYLWQAPSVAAPQVQLTVPSHRHPQGLDPRPYRSVLPPCDVTRRFGIPATTPVRTIVDLSSLARTARIATSLMERVLDEMVRAGHLRLEELANRLAGVTQSPLPRYDAVLLRAMVERRGERGVGASAREDWMFDAVVGAGLPIPARNVRIDVGGVMYEIDLAYPELLIAVEYDGVSVHDDRRHFFADRDKTATLQLVGWMVLQVTAQWTEELLVDRVRQAIDLRRPGGLRT